MARPSIDPIHYWLDQKFIPQANLPSEAIAAKQIKDWLYGPLKDELRQRYLGPLIAHEMEPSETSNTKHLQAAIKKLDLRKFEPSIADQTDLAKAIEYFYAALLNANLPNAYRLDCNKHINSTLAEAVAQHASWQEYQQAWLAITALSQTDEEIVCTTPDGYRWVQLHSIDEITEEIHQLKGDISAFAAFSVSVKNKLHVYSLRNLNNKPCVILETRFEKQLAYMSECNGYDRKWPDVQYHAAIHLLAKTLNIYTEKHFLGQVGFVTDNGHHYRLTDLPDHLNLKYVVLVFDAGFPKLRLSLALKTADYIEMSPEFILQQFAQDPNYIDALYNLHTAISIEDWEYETNQIIVNNDLDIQNISGINFLPDILQTVGDVIISLQTELEALSPNRRYQLVIDKNRKLIIEGANTNAYGTIRCNMDELSDEEYSLVLPLLNRWKLPLKVLNPMIGALTLMG